MHEAPALYRARSSTEKSYYPSVRDLIEVIDLWPSEAALAKGAAIPADTLGELAGLLERAVTEFAPIADPASLVRILARQARKAKADLPERFEAVAALVADYQTALGLSFDMDDERGSEFFRSSRCQRGLRGVACAR